MGKTATQLVKVRLSGQDGNVFAIIGRVSRALRDAGFSIEAKEYEQKCMSAKSYDEVLTITMQTVEVR